MRKGIFGLATVAATFGLLAVVSAAHAQFFTYATTYTDPTGSTTFPGMTTVGSSNPATFLNVFPGGSVNGLAAPTNIGLVTFQPVSTDTALRTITNTNFSLVTTIQRVNRAGAGAVAIGSPGSFTVTGNIAGQLSSVQSNVAISNIHGLPVGVTTGNMPFSITLDSDRNPGVGGSSNGHSMDGGITVHINAVQNLNAVPEPGSVALLAGMGVTGTLFALRLRKRRK